MHLSKHKVQSIQNTQQTVMRYQPFRCDCYKTTQNADPLSEPKSWERMLRGFSEGKALSYRVWNPKTRRVVESRNVTFIKTPPHLIPQPTRLSLRREVSPAESVDDYASTDNLLRDARDYTAVLDFNANIPAEHANADTVDGGPGMEPILKHIRDITRKDLLIPPGESSSGGASSVETLPGGTLPETTSPSSVPDPMPAGDQTAPAIVTASSSSSSTSTKPGRAFYLRIVFV